MGNDRSPESQHNVWRHHTLQCLKEGNSEFESVISTKFKHSIHNASSGFLQVLKRSESKLQRIPGESIFFQMLNGRLSHSQQWNLTEIQTHPSGIPLRMKRDPTLEWYQHYTAIS